MPDPSERLDALADAHCRRIEQEARRFRDPGRLVRTATGVRQAIARKGKEIVQEHWDVGLFDLVFGTLKAFVVYPALYFAGLTWTIPLAEWGPLNTQLWTAGYLGLRAECLSQWGRRHYGHALKELDRLRDELLSRAPRDARGVHRFVLHGQPRVVRIRRNRVRHHWVRWRNGETEPNVLLQRELRAFVGDEVFVHLANPLRHNAPLYERTLLRKIQQDGEARSRLAARLEAEPAIATTTRAHRALLDESYSAQTIARVVDAGDRLVEALRHPLGGRFSAMSLSLRWVHWSYQRHIYRRIADETRLERQWLADVLDARAAGVRVASGAEAGLVSSRRETGAWIDAMEAFGAEASQVRGPTDVWLAADGGIRGAQRRGLRVRLARLARLCSPSLRAERKRPHADAAPPADWDAVIASEARVEKEWLALVSQQASYRHLHAGFEKSAEHGADADRSEIEEAHQAARAFFERLDAHSRALHRCHVAQVQADVARAAEGLWMFYGHARSRRYLRAARRIDALAERYRALEHVYGGAQDHLRIVAFQRLHAAAVDFSIRVRRLDPTAPPVPPPAWIDVLAALGRRVRALPRRLHAGARLFANGVGLLAVGFGARRRTGGTPLTCRVDAFFHALGRFRGLSVSIEGEEHLVRSPEPGTVQLWTPAHRHGVTDNITFAALGLPDYWAFNAVDQLPILPRFLKDRVARAPGLIAVGGGRGSSVDRALEALATGRSRNLLIYPEGSVSEGLRATRPARTGFGQNLVPRLIDAGWQVRIVPITYLDNARFLDLPPSSDTAEDRQRRVVASPALEPEAVRAILDAAGGDALGAFVRLAWLEHLTTDDALVLGAERVASARARLARELDGARYWGSLEAAQVEAPLRPECGDGRITSREEQFAGQRIRVLRFPDDAVRADRAIPLHDLAGSDSRELILGIRDPAHIYLNVGRRRFDGDIFRPLRVRDKASIYPGIAIRFLGVPDQAVLAIARHLERFQGRERRTLTCAHSACQLIADAANLEIDDSSDWRPMLPSHWLPTRVMRKLIERGVVDHRNQRVEIEIYATGDEPLEQMLRRMRANERGIACDHVEGAFRLLTGRKPREEADAEEDHGAVAPAEPADEAVGAEDGGADA